jgi:hypothetical protein
MGHLFNKIDMHIVWMLAMLTVPWMPVLWMLVMLDTRHADLQIVWMLVGWGVLVVLLLPQGRILTRALVDLRPHSKQWTTYLLANEALVLACSAVLLGGWLAAR